MLFDGWDDYTYGVMRTKVLLRTHLHGSHHFADRTINTELGLHGPFYMVPDWLYFRRDHPDRTHPYTVRTRCAYLDPRRANRLRNPVVRLYGEYIWGYVTAIRNAPLSPGRPEGVLSLPGAVAGGPGCSGGQPDLARRRPVGRGTARGNATGHLGRCRRGRPRAEDFVTARKPGGKRAPSADAPRVGLFGKLGSGNIGNDASMEAVLDYLGSDHPDAIVDAMCTGSRA